MDGMKGIDPTSHAFQSKAARNIAHIGAGAVKSQKEMEPGKDPDGLSFADQVRLSTKLDRVEPHEGMEAGAQSGKLSEVTDDLTQDEEERREIRERHQDDPFDVHQKEDFRDLPAEDRMRLKALENDQEAIASVLRDIPESSLEPARNVVAAQTVEGPQAMAELKPVEGTAEVDLQPLPPAGVLDIHDSGNQPIAGDLNQALSPEERRSATRELLSRTLNALPPDRRETVEELRIASASWAREKGGDPELQFTEKLRGLADGWEDDTLRAAADSFLEAHGAGA